MRFSLFFLCIYFLLTNVTSSFAQIKLSGVIKSKENGEIIPRASVGILGSQSGTIANKDGRFSIVLDSGKSYRLRIRAIGYKPDTISLTLNASQEKTIFLSIEPIVGKEIVISSDASRIEARRIIREVIRRKKEWQAKLNDYQCTAYSRWNLRSLSGKDTTVESVLESTADCFWKKDKGFSETITSRRQTANFPPELNAFSVGDIVNFYDNRMEFNDLSLVGPVADDAFSSYDYDLKGTGLLNGASVYQISVEPDLLTQGFEGTLWIDQTDYTIAFLDLSPSKAVKIGPIKEIHLQQTFELFENNFYLPVDLRTNLSIILQLPFIPEFKFELLSVLQNFSINKGINDTLFNLRRHRVAPLADSVDTAKWAAVRAIPLAVDEEKAYHRIDSSVAVASKDSSSSISFFDIISFLAIPRYNHVEGLRFGVSKKYTPVSSFPFSVEGEVAYGLLDKQWKYDVGIKQGILWTTTTDRMLVGDFDGGFRGKVVKGTSVLLSAEGKYFDDLAARGDAYGSIQNTITSLVYNKDYQEFYYQKGFSATLDFTPGSALSATLTYENTHIWDAGSLHIVHPDSINSKQHVSIFDLLVSKSLIIDNITINSSATLQTSLTHIGSDYNFSTIAIDLSLKKRLGGLGVSELTGRYSTLLAGNLPRWNTFFFETRSGFFSNENYFRGLNYFEFQGNRMWSLNLEHNFYDLPTRLLGIHFLDFLDLHWLLHAGIGVIDLTGVNNYSVLTTTGKPYSEIGLGIGNIYNILQLEGTWRLTHRQQSNFYPTLAIKLSF
jgi:hypothetical protein